MHSLRIRSRIYDQKNPPRTKLVPRNPERSHPRARRTRFVRLHASCGATTPSDEGLLRKSLRFHTITDKCHKAASKNTSNKTSPGVAKGLNWVGQRRIIFDRNVTFNIVQDSILTIFLAVTHQKDKHTGPGGLPTRRSLLHPLARAFVSQVGRSTHALYAFVSRTSYVLQYYTASRILTRLISESSRVDVSGLWWRLVIVSTQPRRCDFANKALFRVFYS